MTINSINILIPLKNEEMSIDNLIESLKPILEKIKKKTVITLINDHSSDKTMDKRRIHNDEYWIFFTVWNCWSIQDF